MLCQTILHEYGTFLVQDAIGASGIENIPKTFRFQECVEFAHSVHLKRIKETFNLIEIRIFHGHVRECSGTKK